MKKIISTLFLLLLSGNCVAEWIQVASSSDDESTVFISSKSIKVTGNIRTAWEVMNYSKVSPDGSMSAKVQQEYDCAHNKVRIINASSHSQHFGNGSTLLFAPNTPTKWQVIPKNSIATYTKNYICER